jgi:predicted nucleic acid-binding protein
VAVSAFLDTSVLLAGLVDFGPQSAPAQKLLHAVAEERVKAGRHRLALLSRVLLGVDAVTARIPPRRFRRFRRHPPARGGGVRADVGARSASRCRMPLLRAAAQEGTVGGLIHDAHIAEVARGAGARVIVTDNRRHFVSALRHGLRVETPAEFLHR